MWRPAALVMLAVVGATVSFPDRVMGMYVLLVDDKDSYDSQAVWTPQLWPYQQTGANVLFFTFVNPVLMPGVPPAFTKLARSRGTDEEGAVPKDTTIMFAIGGEAYSKGTWDWLTSKAKAEAMAEHVAQWPSKHGCDGIDIDLEVPAGTKPETGEMLVHFVAKLKSLNKDMLITQPVFGTADTVRSVDRLLEVAFNPNAEQEFAYDSTHTEGSVSAVGIMRYADTNAEAYLSVYTQGCLPSRCSTRPGGYCLVNACVPNANMLVGLEGNAGDGSIFKVQQNVVNGGLGGIMVWQASVRDKATGQPAVLYGSGDASIRKSGAWTSALQNMQNAPKALLTREAASPALTGASSDTASDDTPDDHAIHHAGHTWRDHHDEPSTGGPHNAASHDAASQHAASDGDAGVMQPAV